MTEIPLKKPNLPTSKVKSVVISPEYKNFSAELKKNGINTFFTKNEDGIFSSLRTHADMLCFHVGKNQLFLSQNQKELGKAVEKKGFTTHFVNKKLTNNYPGDVLLNAALIGDTVFLNKKTVCNEILDYVSTNSYKIVETNQGYTKCSVAVVAEKAFITADRLIAGQGEKNGFDVCLIKEGSIKLEGFNYGFIGGCCGKLSDKILAFAGNIKSHPDYDLINTFCKKHGVEIVALDANSPLTDIGGILPLTQEG